METLINELNEYSKESHIQFSEQREIWQRVLILELSLSKMYICQTMDACSASLAFWRDINERPFRVRGIVFLGGNIPNLRALENSMRYFISILGNIELLLMEAQEETTNKLLLVNGFTLIANLMNIPVASLLGKLNDNIAIVLQNLSKSVSRFEQSNIQSGQFRSLSSYLVYWPEIVLGFAACSILFGSVVSGSLHSWLESSSISRRGLTRPLVTDTPTTSMGVLGVLFSKEHLLNVMSRWHDRAVAWISKKISNHVTLPTQNLVNELFNRKKFEAKIELFNENDAKELEYTENVLAELYTQHTSLVPKGRLVDLSAVSPDFEDITRRPVRYLLSYPSQAYIKPILINFYYIKAEIFYVLKVMDYLIKGSNFLFELTAILPAMLSLSYLVKYIAHVKTRPKRSKLTIVMRLRFIFRDLEQLLNRFDPTNPLHIGKFEMLKHQLEETLHQHVIPNLPALDQLTLIKKTEFAWYNPTLVNDVGVLREYLESLG